MRWLVCPLKRLACLTFYGSERSVANTFLIAYFDVWSICQVFQQK